MPAVLYLLLGWFFGYHFLKRFFPGLWQIGEWKSLDGGEVPLPPPVITFPAAFLLGTMAVAWITYFAAYLFHFTGKPLLFGNIFSFLLSGGFLAAAVWRNRGRRFWTRRRFWPAVKTVWVKYRVEIFLFLIVTLVASFMMFHTFRIKDGVINVGLSVFSDFGPHLAVIRSFSYGVNFPTGYPHYANGQARYHFMFQFLAGNLEYLGLRLDWAFNLPSILSLVAFFLLLYALAVTMTGKKGVGILATVLFFFRSSFAIFSHPAFREPGKNMIRALLATDFFIGTTRHEDWGLWAQNVYVNQRHFAFALGLLLLVLILIMPLYRRMAGKLKEAAAAGHNGRPGKLKECWRVFAWTREAWLPQDIKRSILIGVLLGLLSFWNGAVVVAALVILFFFALFSQNRLEYLNMAIFTVMISYTLSLFFIGPGEPAVAFRWSPGFLADRANLRGLVAYYVKLLGVLPFVVAVALFVAPKGARLPAAAFLSPLVLATTVQLTPDMAVNHKYVIISVLLLNIYAAGFLYRLFTLGCRLKNKEPGRPGRKMAGAAGKITAVVLLFFLTVTGVVDLITLYNMNLSHRALKFETDDPVLLWAVENTGPQEIFVTDKWCIHPILLAGRKIFYGWPYFAWSAGYDTYTREQIVNQIYGGQEINRVKELIRENNISYIVLEDGNRNSRDYTLNERLLRDHFTLVYEDYGRRIAVFRTY